MNDIIIYVFITLAAFIAYKKYTQFQILMLVPTLLEQGGQIVDVRSVDEFVTANIDGSVNIPLDSLKERMNELDNTKPIIICCASGSRSAMAKRTLEAKGFENVYNAGTWKSLRKL